MIIERRKLYQAHLYGAKKVMENKNFLNKINVFPVSDGDTGSNLSSMMKVIVHESELKETVKQTFESISDAALTGARGNSGIIFAQYFNGLSMELGSDAQITLKNYIDANTKAVKYAYEAIENPVEGTMLTAMTVWATALSEFNTIAANITEILTSALSKVEMAVKNTQYQLEANQKAHVVDSGAKGFAYFVTGLTEFLLSDKDYTETDDFEIEDHDAFDAGNHEFLDAQDLSYRYCTEALFEGDEVSIKRIREELAGLGDSLVVAGNKTKTRIHIHTNDPATVFEVIQDKSHLIYQKVDDMKIQSDIVHQQRSKIALLTDSIADLPTSFIDEHQIHVIHLSILFEEMSFIDKLTIRPGKLLEYSKDKSLPTSSQPDPKLIENKLSYLLSYYENIIVITVSKELSGTYNTIASVAKKMQSKAIHLIDSKQNSAAEGLIVMECAKAIEQGEAVEEVVRRTEGQVAKSKILVCVKTLDNMIKSGRLSTRAGKIAKMVGMKPIVTLDKEGKGGLSGIAFSFKGSQEKTLAHIKKVMKSQSIKSYAVVHINNEEEALVFADKVTQVVGKKPEYIMETSSIIAAGAGGGAVALAYVLD
jgi:uncharacterized protein